jgi:hypothetical protein
MNITRHPLIAIALALAAVAGAPAHAHGGAQARHGGTVQQVQDLDFELVSQADGAILYLRDHDQPLASAGVRGRLTVLKGSYRAEADLQPAGDNRLHAAGVKLEPGARVVASLSGVRGKTLTVRFVLK